MDTNNNQPSEKAEPVLFDSTDVYNKHVLPLLHESRRICMEAGIPFTFHCCVKTDVSKTEGAGEDVNIISQVSPRMMHGHCFMPQQMILTAALITKSPALVGLVIANAAKNGALVDLSKMKPEAAAPPSRNEGPFMAS